MKTKQIFLRTFMILSPFGLFSSRSIAQITYNHTGAVQTYTVPFGVNEIYIQVYGGEGGKGYPLMSNGGYGGYAEGYLSVSENDVLEIYVGGYGGDGTVNTGGAGGFNGGGLGAAFPGSYSGGGGGGASDVRISPYGLADRIIVAGGGGGAGYNYSTANYDNGGAGGGIDGSTGLGGNVVGGQGAGTGGTASSGGIGGFYSGYCPADNGGMGYGGNGALSCSNAGGGGGSGYYGGGGACWSGGGGGSSYIAGLNNGFTTGGVNSGDGQVVITEICAEDIYTASLSNDITVMADQIGDSYQWLDCDDNFAEISGAISQTYEAITIGNYAVIVTNGTCSDTSNCVAVLSVSLEDQTKIDFKVFPNPSVDGQLSIDFSGVIESIEVVDLFGRKQDVKFDAESKQIDASTLSNGTYIIRILSEGVTTDQKVIIQK